MSLRRGWTEEQDKILRSLKDERKIKKWSSIARIMDFQFHMCGRNGKQCRERYSNHLAQDIVEDQFTLQDQQKLQLINEQIGNKWSVIVRSFKGRTANFLKNQIYSKLRKAIRKLNRIIKDLKLKQFKQLKLNIVYQIVQSNDYKIFEKQRHTVSDLQFFSCKKQINSRIKKKSISICRANFGSLFYEQQLVYLINQTNKIINYQRGCNNNWKINKIQSNILIIKQTYKKISKKILLLR